MNQPTTPAMTATTVPASSALTMNGNAVSCRKSETGSSDRTARRPLSELVMLVAIAVVGGRLGQPDDDEAPVGRLQHLDRDAVEAGERRRGDHLARRCRPPRAQRRSRRPGPDSDSSGLTSCATSSTVTPCWRQIRASSAATARLVGQIEAVQRLVEDQQPRAADQRLGDQQPLLLAAREPPDRPASRTRWRRPARSPPRPARVPSAAAAVPSGRRRARA